MYILEGASILSKMVLCKQLAPDFNNEEMKSIRKDIQELSSILSEMQDYLPQEENSKYSCQAEHNLYRARLCLAHSTSHHLVVSQNSTKLKMDSSMQVYHLSLIFYVFFRNVYFLYMKNNNDHFN